MCWTNTLSPNWWSGSIGRRSSRPGSWRAITPRSWTIRPWDPPRGVCSTTPVRFWTASSASGCSRLAACSASSPRRRWATISRSSAALTGGSRIAVIHTLRQQMAKPPGRPNLALADYVAPRESGVPDHVGAFAVTTGHGLEALVAEFESRTRRLRGHPRQGARRSAGGGLRRAAARAGASRVLGLCPGRGARTTPIWSGRPTRASGRHPAIPPVPITPRSARSSICSRWSGAPVSRSPRASR